MTLNRLKIEALAPMLPELVTDKTRALYSGLEAHLVNIFEGMTPSASDSFKERQREILQANGDEDRIAEIMWHPAYILPLLDLWSTPDSELEPTPNLLNHIDNLCLEHQQGYWGLLPLHKLLQLFFSRYDELEHIKEVGQTLREQLEPEDRNLLFGLDKFKKHAADFLTANGHEHLAALTDGSGRTLADTARLNGIPTLHSRFFEAAQVAYYVARLKRLQPNEEDAALLYEVQDGDVYGKRLDRNDRLGHAVLRILIDKLRESGQTPSDLWRGTLLAIGGDPRVPPTSRSYQNWWMPLEEGNYPQQMTEWLSELDLNLFLEVFANLAQNDPVMLRMFAARKRFLLGLLNKRLIRNTHLFLSPGAVNFVKLNWRAKELPFFTRVSGASPRFVAFYLNLRSELLGETNKSVHMVEGTHNFSLRITDTFPEKLRNLVSTSIYFSTLQADNTYTYNKTYGKSGNFLCRPHDKSGKWIKTAVDFLRKLGVDVVLSDVTDENPYSRRSSTWG